MDKPYAWQHLHVGSPMPTQPSGIDSCAFGAGSWISLKVRDLPLTGFDAFICQYDVNAFEQRMRVTGTPIPRHVTIITSVGISTAQSGTPNVVPAVRFIRPDGNSDQYRKERSMSDVNLMPILGMNTVAEDAALVGENGVYVRNASNVNITPAGKIRLRENSRLATATRYKTSGKAHCTRMFWNAE